MPKLCFIPEVKTRLVLKLLGHGAVDGRLCPLNSGLPEEIADRRAPDHKGNSPTKAYAALVSVTKQLCVHNPRVQGIGSHIGSWYSISILKKERKLCEDTYRLLFGSD